METRLLLGKLFLTFLVLLVPYVIFMSTRMKDQIRPWFKYVGRFLLGGLAVTSFLAIMIAIWE
jgi:hypothetical protein